MARTAEPEEDRPLKVRVGGAFAADDAARPPGAPGPQRIEIGGDLEEWNVVARMGRDGALVGLVRCKRDQQLRRPRPVGRPA